MCTESKHTWSVARALNCTYGIVSFTETVGGLEHVMVGPTSLTSEVIILVNSLDQCMEPCIATNVSSNVLARASVNRMIHVSETLSVIVLMDCDQDVEVHMHPADALQWSNTHDAILCIW